MSDVRASDIARVAAERAVGLPGIARLDAGPLRTHATYGMGGRVEGVTVRVGATPVEVTVHAVVPFGAPIPEIGASVATGVEDALVAAFPDSTFRVGLEVTDLALGDEPDELPGAGAAELATPSPPPPAARRQLR